MEPEKTSLDRLNEKLKSIEKSGIQADRLHLRRNMCTQFADCYEFIREYVVNAYDASATFCLVKVTENESTLTVGVIDNGTGMDLNRLRDFLTIFRSRKDDHKIKPIGRHGIGKLSVAAIPGLTRFKVCTSTGISCYESETDNLLEDHPIAIHKMSRIPPQGTSFEITFKKVQSVHHLSKKLYDILFNYVRHLPIAIRFDVPDENRPGDHACFVVPNGEWTFPAECFGRSYHINLNDKSYEIVMGVGSGAQHEVYQNKVFISSNYNLFSYGTKAEYHIPNLLIRVDSEAFELPFGRHCLCNEEILNDLAREIRERIMPAYFDFLTGHFSFQSCAASPKTLESTNEMVIGLLQYAPFDQEWSEYPVFRTVEDKRLSMAELDSRIAETKAVYLEAENGEGIDYIQFNAPVLSLDQAENALKLIESLYPKAIIDLGSEDTVLEMPSSEINKVSEAEKRFERYLVFTPKNLNFEELLANDPNQDNDSMKFHDQMMKNPGDYAGICEEARNAERFFSDIQWKVNYLSERDGITPCTRKKFMFRNDIITLNLFHAEIKEFVHLSTLNPNLSAHWAIAMCLAEPKILSHISPEAREDLLIIDAMTRVEHDQIIEPENIEIKSLEREFIDFMKNCIYGSSKRH